MSDADDFRDAFEAESLNNPGGVVTEAWVRLYAQENGLSMDRGRELAYMMVNQRPFQSCSSGYVPTEPDFTAPNSEMGLRPWARDPAEAVRNGAPPWDVYWRGE